MVKAKDISDNVIEKLSTHLLWRDSLNIFLPALSFVVALAWRDAFNNTFNDIIKRKLLENPGNEATYSWFIKHPNIPRYIYAILLTIIVVLLSYFLKKIK